jgi:hypothetical protein
LTDFYAYFEITATVTDRVGGVSAEAARGTTPDPFALLQRVKQPHGAYPRVSGVAVELIDVIPHFQAEEFAKHAFMHRPDKGPQPFRCAPDAPAPRASGLQYLWEVDTQLAVRFGFVVPAPTRELAAERAEEARADVEGIGFAAITLEEAQFAKAELGDTRSWVPAELAGRLLEATR